MTTTRDPLAVLRGLRDEMRGLPHSLGYEYTHIAKVDEAIAQVEALVLSVQNAVAAYYDSDDAPNWKAIANDLRLTVQPFTPGQDSEGGGHA